MDTSWTMHVTVNLEDGSEHDTTYELTRLSHAGPVLVSLTEDYPTTTSFVATIARRQGHD